MAFFSNLGEVWGWNSRTKTVVGIPVAEWPGVGGPGSSTASQRPLEAAPPTPLRTLLNASTVLGRVLNVVFLLRTLPNVLKRPR